MLDPKDKEEIQERLSDGSLDEVLRFNTTFPDIHDERFHELREAYIDAAEEFLEYIEGEE